MKFHRPQVRSLAYRDAADSSTGMGFRLTRANVAPSVSLHRQQFDISDQLFNFERIPSLTEEAKREDEIQRVTAYATGQVPHSYTAALSLDGLRSTDLANTRDS